MNANRGERYITISKTKIIPIVANNSFKSADSNNFVVSPAIPAGPVM